jgi:hypothetical protein
MYSIALQVLRTDIGSIIFQTKPSNYPSIANFMCAVLMYDFSTQLQPGILENNYAIYSNASSDELMIWANEFAAMRIALAFPDAALLRRHLPSKAPRFQELVAVARTAGIDVDASSGKALSPSTRCVKARQQIRTCATRRSSASQARTASI